MIRAQNLKIEYLPNDHMTEYDVVVAALIQQEIQIGKEPIWNTLRWIIGEDLEDYFQVRNGNRKYRPSPFCNSHDVLISPDGVQKLSKYMGVHWNAGTAMWDVVRPLGPNGTMAVIGSYESEWEAAKAYDASLKPSTNPYIVTNF